MNLSDAQKSLLKQHQALLIGKWITDLSNTSAFIMTEMPNLNWAGFYLLEGETLFLGPFQGKPACTEIKIGKGVCGTAVKEDRNIIVKDVHEFPGHIACDAASNSEIVLPIKAKGKILGVLDLDSPNIGRFSEADEVFLSALVKQLIEKNISQL